MNIKICQVINKLKHILYQRKHSPVASLPVSPSFSRENFNAKLDSGASKHFFKSTHLKYLNNIQKLSNGPIAHLPNNTTVQATHKATINLHANLSRPASEVLIFPHLTNESLLSIGQLCDDNCIIIFTKTNFFVTKNGRFLFQGSRNKQDGLWDLHGSTQTPIPPQANYIISKDKTKLELARYYHATLFSPSLSTLSKAINNGNLSSWPGITDLNFKSLIGTSLATELGHLDQERKNLRSTQALPNESTPPVPSTKTKEVYITCYFENERTNLLPVHRKIYSDQTGAFPYKSSRGNQYLLVMYDYDSNAIVFEPLKTRQSKAMVQAFDKCCQKLKVHSTTSNMFVLDNECSNDIKSLIKSHNSNYQLVPPYQHRQNAAEKAIRTVKNHLLSGLATCHKNFPITEWDRLLPQAEITLNLLRNSRVNPTLSAWEFLNGPMDFNKTPMAPPGSNILIHTKPSKRASWAFHGLQGWYIGPALQHYRCVQCYVPKTRSEVISDTVKFIPDYVPIPTASIDDYIKEALEKAITLIQAKHTPTDTTINAVGPSSALIRLSHLLNNYPPDKNKNIFSAPATPIVPQQPPVNFQQPTKFITTEGGAARKTNKSRTPKQKITPMTDAEFEMILKQLRQPLPTSEGAKPLSTRPRNNHQQDSLRTKCLYAHNPIPKIKRHSTTADVMHEHLTINHMYDGVTGKKQSLDKLLQTNPTIWTTALSNELGRLAQGIRTVDGNDVMDFIFYSDVPQDRIVTYANFVCDIRPLKTEQFRVRLTVGGDRLEYPDDTASPAATLLESKLLLNSTISQSAQGARFMTLDIKDFFLQTFMERPEYMKIHSKYFLPDIREKYDIASKIHRDGYVYCKIKCGMYGLKQAARLAYDSLKTHLGKHGYFPDKIATNIWSHTTR